MNFRSHDPAWSKQFLELLIGAYLDYHAHISHDPAAEQFFSQQAKLLQAKLDDAEEQLREFQVKSGITSVDDQRAGLVDRLDQLQLQLDKNQADLAYNEQQAISFKELLDQTPPRLSKETRQVQNMALAQLKPQVMQLRAERAELLTRYQPDSERIRQIDAKLAAAQKILDTEDHLEVSEKSTDINPLWVTINSNLEPVQGAGFRTQGEPGLRHRASSRRAPTTDRDGKQRRGAGSPAARSAERQGRLSIVYAQERGGARR